MSTDKARRGRPKGSGLDDRLHLDALRGLIAQDPSLKPTTAIKMLGITDPSAIRRLRDKLKNGDAGPQPDEPIISAPHRDSLETVTDLPKSIVAACKFEDDAGSNSAVLARPAAQVAVVGAQAERGLRLVASGPGRATPHAAPASAAPAAPAAAPQTPSAVTAPAAAGVAPEADRPKRAASHAREADASTSTSTRAAEPGPQPQNSGNAKAENSANEARWSSSMSWAQSHGDDASTLLVRWYALGMTAYLSAAEAQMTLMKSVLKVPPVASAVKQQLMFCELAKAFLAGGPKPPRR